MNSCKISATSGVQGQYICAVKTGSFTGNRHIFWYHDQLILPQKSQYQYEILNISDHHLEPNFCELQPAPLIHHCQFDFHQNSAGLQSPSLSYSRHYRCDHRFPG